jgi:hypothetical protein
MYPTVHTHIAKRSCHSIRRQLLTKKKTQIFVRKSKDVQTLPTKRTDLMNLIYPDFGKKLPVGNVATVPNPLHIHLHAWLSLF